MQIRKNNLRGLEKMLRCRICGMPSEPISSDPDVQETDWRCTHCHTTYRLSWEVWEKLGDKDVVLIPRGFSF
ncbi:hypothetical protein [Aestuariispira insulae]|uniref:Uncharacterized protein n=1 Tax=Aestuariispira insulae TaxID=1461337 RepID=A0A3D9HWM3_9PROT|nr:hypothetical protein [Aestuariispira insulae]RED53815.1 hypothetical protein DFP90_101614 [Aestuariispira insulae]